MKINAKDLCSIKDIQELKSVDSINNILKVINSEITPMSVTAQTYEELFSVIAVLKKQWNNFNSDVYFKNENVKDDLFTIVCSSGGKKYKYRI